MEPPKQTSLEEGSLGTADPLKSEESDGKEPRSPDEDPEPEIPGGIQPVMTRHLNAIPAWWWLVKPRTAFKALLAMKELSSSKVAPVPMDEPYIRGTGGSKGGSPEASDPEGRMKLREGISIPLAGEVKWTEIWAYGLDWISNPLNIALTFWCILCIVPSIIIILVESGALDEEIPESFVREEWVEVSNQVLNGLFVLMCLVWNPMFFRLSYQLYRWSPEDIAQLRSEYCRGGRRKPNEWWHISVIVFWFHTTCLATYAYATVYWVYNRWDRPTEAVISTVLVSFGSPIIAFTYNVLSPLGRDFYLEVAEDAEAPPDELRKAPGLGGASEADSALEGRPKGAGTRRSVSLREAKSAFYLSHRVVPYPQWRGRIVADCCQKPRLAVLTCLFPFCVFGLNMERLGFGQRWVSAASFVLIVIGPCLVFQICAHTVKLYEFQQLITLLGLCLAVLGILYGSYWRIQMRRKFRLPAYRWCLGSATLTDMMIWQFCCCCALCQEVRTAEYYDIGDNAFFEKSEEERRRIAQGEGLQAVGLGEATKQVAKFREGLKDGIGDAGKGMVRILSRVGLAGLVGSGSVAPVEEDAQTTDSSETSATDRPDESEIAVDPPQPMTMEGSKKGT